jgi:hypothetical protein
MFISTTNFHEILLSDTNIIENQLHNITVIVYISIAHLKMLTQENGGCLYGLFLSGYISSTMFSFINTFKYLHKELF